MRAAKEQGKAYVLLDEPEEIVGIVVDEHGDHLRGPYRRTPFAFIYDLRERRLRNVEPLSVLVASPKRYANVYKAHMLIYLEDDDGRRSAYVEFCRLPFAVCEAAEDAADRVWRGGGTVGDVIEAVESLAVL